MLTPKQVVGFARRLGVAEAHIRLDHLLSHVLYAMAQANDESLVFFGGTALARTHLFESPWQRVSEDLDLFVRGDRAAAAHRYEQSLPPAIRREYPDAAWLAPLTRARPPAPALLGAAQIAIRVQLLPASGAWSSLGRVPVELGSVNLRYPDLPEHVQLPVPTLEGFAAMKLGAWEDRHAPRDLFDLAGLGALGALNRSVFEVFQRLNGRPPDGAAYDTLPERVRDAWQRELAHQTADLPSADACLHRVAASIYAL